MIHQDIRICQINLKSLILLILKFLKLKSKTRWRKNEEIFLKYFYRLGNINYKFFSDFKFINNLKHTKSN